MSDRLIIERREPAPGVTEVLVDGEVDLGSGRRLGHELDAAMADGSVLVNLGACTFLDSSGLSAIVRKARQAPEPGRFAVYCPAEGAVRQVFSLTRAHTLLALHAHRDEALAALSA